MRVAARNISAYPDEVVSEEVPATGYRLLQRSGVGAMRHFSSAISWR